MQQLKANIKGMSKLFLILLLLLSAIIGGLLAYTWTIGYYVVLYSAPPKGTMMEILPEETKFPVENSTYFEVTFFNPSTSKENATITRIAITTKDSSVLEEVYSTNPKLPYVLPIGEKKTFTCIKYWGDFAGKEIGIITFIREGTGPTLYKSTDYVKLEANTTFDSTRTIEWFTATVSNNVESKIALNLTRIYIDIIEIPAANITPSIGTLGAMQPGDTITFNCTYNWEGLMGFNHTLKVGTAQGYKTEFSTGKLPNHVDLTISGVSSNETIPYHFNVTIRNGPDSPHYVNITRIEVFYENVTILKSFQVQQAINANSTVTITILEYWTLLPTKIKIVAYTLQGFKTAPFEYQFPP